MFYLIGIGLNPKQITREALDAIKDSGKVFFESYTSTYSDGAIGALEELCGKKFVELNRKGVEEGFGLFLKEAKEAGQDIALLVFGNALNATTHVQLLIQAKALGMKYAVIPGISVFDYLPETGLDAYKFGRVCTIVAPKKNFAPEDFYNVVEKNFAAGLHTLCLLEIDSEREYQMSVSDAVKILQKIEARHKGEILNSSMLIGLYALGSKGQRIKKGNLKEFSLSSFGGFPQSLIVCGKLNEKEKEAVKKLC
ncbi:MAG: diphthine synthase [Candidatus Diapherotrites archaeon]|nr:diphthine synthase [Candidatus Diapherotrites archaeon]